MHVLNNSRLIFLVVCPESMELAQSIGQAIAKLHNADVVHGDLTTSNFMVSPLDDSGERPLVMASVTFIL